MFKSSNLSQSRSKIHNHKGQFTPTARVKAEVAVNPVSARLKTSEAGWLCPPELYGHCARCCVSGGRQRQRTHFFKVCWIFFPTLSEDLEMPSYVLHLVLVSLAGARGVLWFFIRALAFRSLLIVEPENACFWEWKVFATHPSRRAVQGEAAFHTGLECYS